MRSRAKGLLAVAVVGGCLFAGAGQALAACPNEAVRIEQGTTGLPDCRAYELVSPQEKAAQDVHRTFTTLRSSDDGERVTYTGYGSFPGEGVQGATWGSRYLAARGNSAIPGIPWSGRSIDSRQDPQMLSFLSLAAAYQNLQSPDSFNGDLTVSTEQNFQVQLDPDHPTEPGVVNLFRRQYAGDTYEMLSPIVGPALNWFFANGSPEFVAATPNREKILFEDQQNLTPEFEDNSVIKLYEWDRGVVRLVGILPEPEGGAPAPGGSAGAAGVAIGKANISPQARGSRPNVMSEDGSRVFFLEGNPDSEGRLFMREHNGQPDARTLWISESERTAPEASQPATFWAADPSGTQVTFSSAESLVDGDTDSSPDLYRYDLGKPAGERLSQISKGTEPAEFEGVIGSSSDQSRVYFVAGGALTPEAPADGSQKLYLWSSGSLRYVASLGIAAVSEVGENWAERGYEAKLARVSPDGRYALFRSAEQLTSYANDGFEEFYLFDADAPSGSAIACVSCRVNGTAPTAGATIGHRDGSNNATPYQPRTMVDDGGHLRVFFESYDAVVPQDQNGVRDVYEYDNDSGRVSLLSAATSGADSFFMDADESGGNVFIATRFQLVRWDRDPLYDVYDVRSGGGVVEPPLGSPCTGDECQGQASAPSVAAGSASSAVAGPGNAKARRRSVKSRCAKRRAKKAGRRAGRPTCARQKKHKAAKKHKRNGSAGKGGKR